MTAPDRGLQLQILCEMIPGAVVVVGRDGCFQWANSAAEHMFGYGRDEMLGRPVEGFFPEGSHAMHSFLAEQQQIPEQGKGAESGRLELRGRCKDGVEFPAEISLGRLPEDSGGTVLAVVRDLTEQKQVEEALLESDMRYRALVEMSPEAIIVHSSGKIVFANAAAAKCLGVESAGDLVGRMLLDFVPEDYKEAVLERIASNLRGAPRTDPLALEVRLSDGRKVYLEALGAPVPYRGGKGAQVVIRDITHQKRTEHELVRLNNALRSLRAADQLLVRAAEEETFLKEVCKIVRELGGYELVWVGYGGGSAEQPVVPVAWTGNGQMQAVASRAQEEKVAWGMTPAAEAFCSGEPVIVRDIAREIEPPPATGAVILSLPLLVTGKAMGCLVIRSGDREAFDEAEVGVLEQFADDLAFGVVSLRAQRDRERAEQQLKQSREQLRSLASHLQTVREAERTHIAREIHDELGQALTALKMDLAAMEDDLAEGLTEPGPYERKIHTMSSIIDSTIQTMRRIATELRPVLLDSLGLLPAIEWQVEEFQNRTGIVCSLNVSEEDIPLDKDRSTAVFRICQETLTNVTKHAEATIVTVTLKREGPIVCLMVKDNGKGIADDDRVKSNSFGLLGMQERALLFGGEVSISGRAGEGTTVSVQIPIAAPSDNGSAHRKT